MLLKTIYLLPEDVAIYKILPYISISQLLLTNKKYYEKNIIQIRLKNIIQNKMGISLSYYIKKIISLQLNYIFSLLISAKYDHWNNIKRYTEHSYRYDTYICFLDELCVELKSKKCINVIKDYQKKNHKCRIKRRPR
jgi:hypothetical protein